MNKIERVRSALNSQPADRPPFSFWYHFGLQHASGKVHAQAEIDFYRAYDLDFLKVMNDYPYPLPSGIEALDTEEDWKRIEPLSETDPAWAPQLEALSRIAGEIGSEAMFIDTIFSPWTTARRLARSGSLLMGLAQFPGTILTAMQNISTSLATYAKQAVARGASGIFLSLGAATDQVMPAEEYKVWCRPFDLAILNAVSDSPFNVLHVHGTRIHFDAVSNYPAAAINWSHHLTDPALKAGKVRWGKAVLGGVNEATASHVSAPEIAGQVSEALAEVGKRGLLLTPGCSVPTDTPVRNLSVIKQALENTR